MLEQNSEWLLHWLWRPEATPICSSRKRSWTPGRIGLLQLEERITPTFLGGVTVGAGDMNADGYMDIVTAPGAGGGPHVRIFSGESGKSIGDFFAYDPAMRSGLTIGVGDVTGDKRPDIVTAPGIGGGPLIRIFDGVTLTEVGEFFAYDSAFRGGVSVAVGDTDGDGTAEVITGMLSGGSEVRVFNALTSTAVSMFTPFEPNFAGGSWVSTTDLDGDNRQEILVGAASESTAVRVFNTDGSVLRMSFSAYEPQCTDGVRVAGGDVNGDGIGDITTMPGFGGGPRVQVFDGRSTALIPPSVENFFSYDPEFRGGAFVATADLDQDGQKDLITGAGRDGTSHVRAFRSQDGISLASFIAYDPETLNGGFARRLSGPTPVGPTVLTDNELFASESSQKLALSAVTQGTRTLNFDVSAALDRSDTSGVEDTFNVYIVDTADRSKTLLDRGIRGTSVFSLVGDRADLAAEAGVRFDGKTVSIDVTGLDAPNGATLILQLVNMDGNSGSKVEISPPTYTEDLTGVSGPKFPQVASVALKPGSALPNVDSLNTAPTIRGELTNIRFDPTDKTLIADLVVENQGPDDLGRNLIVRFDGLPTGVILSAPSGTDGAGRPYLNLRDAVPVGGLGSGERTRPVTVSFQNPNLKQITFNLSAAAGPNTAPELGEPNDALIVRPGEILNRAFPLSDADGDPLTIVAKQKDGNALPDFPIFSLDPSGKLQVLARPDQVGTYDLTITVSDGASRVSRNVTLSVQSDLDTRTRVSGRLLNTDDQPLASVRIGVGSDVTSTDSQGNFVLPLSSTPKNPLKLAIYGNEILSPVAYHYVEMALNSDTGFLGRKEIYAGANNQIANPIYLQALDLANAVTVDPTRDTVVRSSVDGLRLTIPAGSLHTIANGSFGALYTGKVSLSVVKNQKTPMPLAREFLPDYVITFQPVYEPGQARVELQFDVSRPGQLLQPYDGPLPEGSAFDLIGFDVDGVMKKLGDAKVIPTPPDPDVGTTSGVAAAGTSSGLSIASTNNAVGLRSGSCDFHVPQGIPVSAANNSSNPDEGCGGGSTASATSKVELHSGVLLEEHTTPAYQSLGETRAVTLNYDSMRADPRPIVNFATNGFGQVAESLIPNTRLIARLSVRRGGNTTQVAGAAASPLNPVGEEHFWRITEGQTSYQAALQADLRNRESGRYAYSLEAGLLLNIRERLRGRTTKQDGTFISVNTIESPFGAGWGVAGLQWLSIEPALPGIKNSDGTPDEGGVLLIDGNGTQLFFKKVGSSFLAPPGDFSTFEMTVDGHYRRTLPDQTTYLFNSDLDLESVRDRNGNTTTYRYVSARQITEMIDPVGLKTTFNYGDNGKVTEIVNPDGRNTVLGYDSVGNLRSVTAPDGAKRTWSYDVDHHMTGELDPRGNRESALYNFAGRVVEARLKDGSVKRFSTVQSRLLFSPQLTTSFDNAPVVPSSMPAEAFVADANGNIVESTLDRAGHTVKSRDWQGSQAVFERNSSNLVTRTTDARGNVVDFKYDRLGNVIVRQDIADKAQILAHNTDNPALFWIDPINAAVTPIGNMTREDGRSVVLYDIAYNAGLGYFGVDSNAVIYKVDPSDAKLTTVGNSGVRGLNSLTFDESGTLFGATNQLYTIDLGTGVATKRGSNTFGGLLVSGDLEFAPDGKLYATVDGNNGSTLALVDSLTGQITVIGNGIGGAFGQVFGLATSFSGLYGLTGNGQLITIDTATGGGTLISNFQDARATVSRIGGGTIVTSVPGPRRRMTYDSTYSQLTEVTDELGHRTLTDIDPNNGNVLKSTRVMNLPDGAAGDAEPDLVTRYTYNARGQILTVTDPLGRITANEYDDLGRLTAVTSASGSTDETTTRYEYFAAPLGLSGNVKAMTDGNGNRTEYEYDLMNRVVKVTKADPDGPGPLASPVTEMKYDPNGNLVESTDAIGSVTTYAYDTMNRRSVTIAPDPDGPGTLTAPVSQMTYEPNGNLRSVVDPNGNVTEYRYDERRRRIQTIDPDGGSTQFRYDPDNNLVSLQDPGGNLTQFGYDFRGRQVTETDPLGKTTTYVYDPANRLNTMTDRIGRVIDYSYDDNNRMVREDWVGGGNAVNYRYDSAGNLILIEDAFSKLAFTPDDLNRTKSVDNTGTPGTPQVLLNYEYDDNGNVVTVRDRIGGVDGATTSYKYDFLDRLNTESQVGPNVVEKRVEFGYNSLGQYTTMDRFLGAQSIVSTAFAYDDMHRLTNITHGPAATPVQFFNYAYDPGNRITQIASKTDTVNYGYDKRDELTKADYQGNTQADELYRYDANGNRLESHRHGTGYQTDPNTANRLKSDGTYNYEYDANGNQTKRITIADGTVRALTWDYRNRLTKVTDMSTGGVVQHEVSFAYDALDRRITKASGGVTTHFVNDRNEVLLDFVGTTLDTRYFHGPGIDQVLAQESNGAVQWLLTDHLGSTRAVLDESGTQLVEYDAYGNPAGEITSRYGFTGREWDADILLTYHRARYVDNIAGRFMSQDPESFNSGTTNLYGYTANRPTNFIDPSGRDDIMTGSVTEGYDPSNRFGSDNGVAESPGFIDGLIFGGFTVAGSSILRGIGSSASRIFGFSSATAELGRKLDFLFGLATGTQHNIDRSLGMLCQMERVGLGDNAANRQLMADYFASILRDPKTVRQIQTNGRTVRESLLMGPNGSVKIESIWEGNRLITFELFGNSTRYRGL